MWYYLHASMHIRLLTIHFACNPAMICRCALGFDLTTNGEVSFEVTDPAFPENLAQEDMIAKWLVALLLGISLVLAENFVPDKLSLYMVILMYTCIWWFGCMYERACDCATHHPMTPITLTMTDARIWRDLPSRFLERVPNNRMDSRRHFFSWLDRLFSSHQHYMQFSWIKCN